MNILVTGASGFVGRALVPFLSACGHQVLTLSKNANPESYFSSIVKIDCVVHLAGRAHVSDDGSQSTFAEFRQANIDYALSIARQARLHHAQRFILISSLGVHGKNSSKKPFKEEDTPHPHNQYALTKWQAEQALNILFKDSDVELTVIRPPLIYGPHGKANFKTLLQVCNSMLPLPFGLALNLRSMIGIHHFCEFVELCCRHPLAANQTFLVSDDEDLTLADLISCIRSAMHRPTRLLPVHPSILRIALTMIGKKNLAEQLLNNLQVDVSKAKNLLNWQPSSNVKEEIKRAVSHVI